MNLRACTLIVVALLAGAAPASAAGGQVDTGYDWGAAALGVGGGLGAFVIGSIALALWARRQEGPESDTLPTGRDGLAGI